VTIVGVLVAVTCAVLAAAWHLIGDGTLNVPGPALPAMAAGPGTTIVAVPAIGARSETAAPAAASPPDPRPAGTPGSGSTPGRSPAPKPPLRGDAQGWESSADPGDPVTVATVSHGRQSALAGDRSPESGSLSPRLTGNTLASATAGQAPDLPAPTPAGGNLQARGGEPDTYQLLYQMVTAVNDAWLDRLFGAAA
jgi:hypothetical protein